MTARPLLPPIAVGVVLGAALLPPLIALLAGLGALHDPALTCFLVAAGVLAAWALCALEFGTRPRPACAAVSCACGVLRYACACPGGKPEYVVRLACCAAEAGRP